MERRDDEEYESQDALNDITDNRASCKIILNRLGIDEKLLFRSFFIRKYPKISAKFSARSIYNRFLSVLEHTFPSAPPFPCPKIILVSDQMTGWITKRIN